jgi:hypothetical protein
MAFCDLAGVFIAGIAGIVESMGIPAIGLLTGLDFGFGLDRDFAPSFFLLVAAFGLADCCLVLSPIPGMPGICCGESVEGAPAKRAIETASAATYVNGIVSRIFYWWREWRQSRLACYRSAGTS